MTTYILIGGNMRTSSSDKKAELSAVVQKAVHGPLRMTAVFFGEPREAWEDKFNGRYKFYESLFGNPQVRLTTPETFLDDVAWANVIFLHGGYETRIAQHLDKIPSLEKLFTNKVIIGDSAGAVYLAKDAWSAWIDGHLSHGRGLVPVAVIPHFGSKDYDKYFDAAIDWKAAKRELAAATNLPIHVIRDGDFEIFEETK